jgi:hypothetical protein
MMDSAARNAAMSNPSTIALLKGIAATLVALGIVWIANISMSTAGNVDLLLNTMALT